MTGLLLGSTGSTSSWLLAATMAVFLYVALVSMLSEIRATSPGGVLLNTVRRRGGR